MNFRFPWPELAAAACVGLSNFVELHIWSPAYSYFMLMLLVVLDVVTDLVLNQRRRQLRRLLLILPAYTLVLAFAHSFGKHEPGLIWLPQAVIVLMVVIHLRRLIRNFGRLELVDGDVASVLDARLQKRVDEPVAVVEAQLLPPVPVESVPADAHLPA